MRARRLALLMLPLLLIVLIAGGWAWADTGTSTTIVKTDHVVTSATGITMYGIEKKAEGSEPRAAVLLIHGSGMGYPYFDLQAEPNYSMMDYLALRGCDVFAFDLRGYGKSTKPNGLEVRAEAAAEDLKDVLQYIQDKTGFARISIAGHSWGGCVAICVAAKYPNDIDRVVLMGTPYREIHPVFQPAVTAFVGLAHQGVEYVDNTHHLNVQQRLHTYDQSIVDEYKAIVSRDYAQMPSAVFLEFDDWAYADYVTHITAPTLIINGAEEYVVNREDGFNLLKDLGSVEKDLLTIGNGYHLMFIDKNCHWRQNEAIAGWVLGRPAAVTFADTAASSYQEAIQELADYGYVSGYGSPGGHEFRPEENLLRAQFAKIMSLALRLGIDEAAQPPFLDLGADDPSSLYPHQYVAALALRSIAQGTGAGNFGPWETISRAQLATMVVRAVQVLDSDALDPLPEGYVPTLGMFGAPHDANLALAESNGLLVGLSGFGASWDPWKAASRGEMAQMVFNLLNLN